MCTHIQEESSNHRDMTVLHAWKAHLEPGLVDKVVMKQQSLDRHVRICFCNTLVILYAGRDDGEPTALRCPPLVFPHGQDVVEERQTAGFAPQKVPEAT